MSKSQLHLCLRVLKRLLILQGSYFKAGVEKEGRAGGPGPWVPILAPHWLLNSASLGSRSCSSWEAMSSRLGTAEGERAVNVSP